MNSIVLKLVGVAATVLGLAGCRMGCVEVDWTAGRSPTCEVHRMLMGKTVLPIAYGTPDPTEWSNARDRARRSEFPHADEAADGGCIVESARQAVVYYCPQCRLARKAWEAQHPRPPRHTEESFAGEWVGLEMGWGNNVFKLMLNTDRTGVLTQASTSDTKIHVYRYEIARWFLGTNEVLECEFRQRSTTEPLRLIGSVVGSKSGSLTTLLHNGERGWKQSVLFWRAGDLEEKMRALGEGSRRD